MKVSTIIISKDQEEEVLLKVHTELNEHVLKSIEGLIHSMHQLPYIMGKYNGDYYKVKPEAIYYIESVDRKQFIYTDEYVLETDEKLYALEEQFAESSLIRVSKSMILNIDKIESFAPKLSGNLEACLSNKEKVSISRRYVTQVKQQLGMKEAVL